MQLLSLVIYNIAVRLYGAGIFIASLFNPRARLWIEGRKKQVIAIPVTTSLTGKRVWVHCASLGEFEQARPVIEKIKSSHPAAHIILTFFSPSGYEIRKNYPVADAVYYLPLDTPANARMFIHQIKPDLVLFVKYEFWYNYLSVLKARKIPVVLFSAIFRNEQIFFKWYGALFRKALSCFDKIFVQNQQSQHLLKGISISSEVSFDTRFDRVFQISQSAKNFRLIEKFKGNYKLFIAGSTWPKDEQLVSALIKEQVLNNYKYMIAPHNLNEDEIAALQKYLPNATRLSELNESSAEETLVIIVDTMGDLSSLYRYADIAYVGGAFNASVHNVLEPAVFGLPVIFGPNYLKSEEAKELIAANAAFYIINFKQLKTAVLNLDNNTAVFAKAALQSAQYVKQHLGGINNIYNYIAAYL